ncbi:MAG TPA: polysaccharide lyase, partial [Myxococcaceae bacterium]|nr:polysaccharide lyase [Myxococcaceae bacterium]
MKSLLKLAPFVLVPALASAAPVWKGDFETGNLSQWDRTQSVASNRLLVVSEPVREGQYALKVTVKKGDDPIDASGNRNELLSLRFEEPGSEYFYKWSTLFPASFPRSPKWQMFTQWHHEGSSGSPPVELYVVDDEMRLRVGGSSGTVVWRAPLQREQWNDFILHVQWSSDPKVGFIELYHDGELVLPRTRVATQYKGDRNYLKVGLYRDASISPEGVIFHDGFVMATTLEDVLPPPPPPVAEPAPAPAPEPA